MTAAQFPYLTLELVKEKGALLLAQGAPLWPPAAPALRALEVLLPLLDHISVLHEAAQYVLAKVQHLLDEINAITGAQPAAVTG